LLTPDRDTFGTPSLAELLADPLAELLEPPALHPVRARLIPRTAAAVARYRDFRFRVCNMLDPLSLCLERRGDVATGTVGLTAISLRAV
jgi:hypothetical protein